MSLCWARTVTGGHEKGTGWALGEAGRLAQGPASAATMGAADTQAAREAGSCVPSPWVPGPQCHGPGWACGDGDSQGVFLSPV